MTKYIAKEAIFKLKKAIACIFAASIALTAFAGCSRRTPVYTPAPSPAMHRNLTTPYIDGNHGTRGTSPYGGGAPSYRATTPSRNIGDGNTRNYSASPKVSPATTTKPATRGVAPKNNAAPKSHTTKNMNRGNITNYGGIVTTSPAVR